MVLNIHSWNGSNDGIYMKKVLIPIIRYVWYELAAPVQGSNGKWFIPTQDYPNKALTGNLEIEVATPSWDDKFYFHDALEAILAAHDYYGWHGYSEEDYPWVFYAGNVITLEHYHKICSRAKGTVGKPLGTVESEVMEFV
jgi:hypothetical protein